MTPFTWSSRGGIGKQDLSEGIALIAAGRNQFQLGYDFFPFDEREREKMYHTTPQGIFLGNVVFDPFHLRVRPATELDPDSHILIWMEQFVPNKAIFEIISLTDSEPVWLIPHSRVLSDEDELQTLNFGLFILKPEQELVVNYSSDDELPTAPYIGLRITQEGSLWVPELFTV